jgi:hypothetical protein
MKIYETNAALGYAQLAYLVQLDKTENGHNYLVIGGKNISSTDNYEIGSVVEDLEDYYIEESEYELKESPLYGSFLFDFFLKNQTVIIE